MIYGITLNVKIPLRKYHILYVLLQKISKNILTYDCS